MKYFAVLFMLSVFNYTYAQQTFLVNENFNNGMPTTWNHCSGNWGTSQTWSEDGGAIRESSGPYFGGVWNAVQLPALDLTEVSDAYLEFDLAMAVIDSSIQFSVWWTTDTLCNLVWDTIINQYVFDSTWNLHSRYDSSSVATDINWTPQSSDYQKISIDLSPFSNETDIRFALVSEYMNAHAYGVWYLDNVQVFGNSNSAIGEYAEAPLFAVFPNPANQVIQVVPRTSSKNALVKIIDLSGSEMLALDMTSGNQQIDVSGFAAGIYFVCYFSEKGKSVQKLIISE